MLVIAAIAIIAMVISASFLIVEFSRGNTSKTTAISPNTPFYVGVTYCGNNVTEAKLLIDRVRNYTNLFVIQSGPSAKECNPS